MDLGSAYTKIYIPGKGIVFNERSALVKKIHTDEVIDAGGFASEEERLPKTMKIVRPVRDGVVCDVKETAEFLSAVMAKVRRNKIIKPRIMLSVPGEITEVEGKAFAITAMNAGARQVVLMSAPMTSALGAGCDITLTRGLMTVDIGAEKTDVAAISHCNCVMSKTIRLGGGDFTEALKAFVKKKFKLEIGAGSAEKIKKELGINQTVPPKTIEVYGKDISNKLPRKIIISATDISEVYAELVKKLSDFVKDALDSTPAELVGDIIADGILLTGGGAKLDGLAEKLKFGSGVKVFAAENAELCNIKGLGLAFEHMEEIPDVVKSYHNL